MLEELLEYCWMVPGSIQMENLLLTEETGNRTRDQEILTNHVVD